MEKRFESNVDALVGPTHNYVGMGLGNKASNRNRGRISNPRAAALQGLEKMRRLHELGIRQIVMPPAPRPDLGFLRGMGFTGNDARVIEMAAKTNPDLLAIAYSASSMWAANAATICPSVDATDGHVHFTPANLSSQPHRGLETAFTARCLRAIFPSGQCFVHQDPLPSFLGDEGAANHTRFSGSDLDCGVHLFVHGGRQSRQASEAVARLHGIPQSAIVFTAQSPEAVAAGVFHNDVISVGHEDFFLYHEHAFVDTDRILRALRRAFFRRCGKPIRVFTVRSSDLNLADAVSTYLFNSQIVTLPGGGFLLLAAEECRRHSGSRKILGRLLEEGFVARVEYLHLRQSMRNGGGPACLRLRVELTEGEWGAVNPKSVFNESLYRRLKALVSCDYRDRLGSADLRDPDLFMECRSIISGLKSF